jgi:hypothetical protein
MAKAAGVKDRADGESLWGFLVWLVLLGLVVAYDFHLTLGPWVYQPDPQWAAKTEALLTEIQQFEVRLEQMQRLQELGGPARDDLNSLQTLNTLAAADPTTPFGTVLQVQRLTPRFFYLDLGILPGSACTRVLATLSQRDPLYLGGWANRQPLPDGPLSTEQAGQWCQSDNLLPWMGTPVTLILRPAGGH